jgi:heme/copper-type cytochrome/quinol oxidase subunit 3
MSAAQGTIGEMHAAPGPASKRVIVGYGFWIFLLSDIVMFSAFFAGYAVLSNETAGGPSGKACSISTSWRSRRHACCCPVSPAVSPASAPEPTTI